ncbi:MAG: ATP-binding protein, partial [Myxococcota bacterium]
MAADSQHEDDPILASLIRIAQADFSVRVDRDFSGDRNDTLAFLINTVAEELHKTISLLQSNQERLEAAVETLVEVLSAHAAGQFDVRAPRSMDGSPLDVLAFVVNNTGEETGRIVTELNQAYRLLELTKETEAMNRARTAFLANVSHELRTPLTLVLGPLQTALAQPGLPLPVHEDLQVAVRNASRLARMVNDLLDFTKADEQKLVPRWQLLDAGAVVSEALEDLQRAAGERGLRLTGSVAEGLEPVALDRRMFEKIVMNFLGNALKFTPAGGEVEASVGREGDVLVFAVRDTGIGISEADIDRVFERFLQIDSSQSRNYEGSGLGLSLAREFARAMDGDATVESTLGVGSTFSVRIPVAEPREGLLPADVEPSIPEESRGDVSGAASSPPAAVQTSPETEAAPDSVDRPYVLVVEDNPDVRNYIKTVLGGEFELQAVADGVEALDSLDTRLPEVIVSDVMMPNMDGFELTRRLKAVPVLAAIPILLLTARAGSDAAAEGL